MTGPNERRPGHEPETAIDGGAPTTAIDAAAHYERYKDALRRGHVAAVNGRLAAALAAYADAAELAPERALPQVCLGGVLARMGRLADALARFDRALALGPADEGSLDGRAAALVALGRRTEAAETLDRLADLHDAAGRPAGACDAARRALELAESRERRRAVEAYAARLRAEPGEAGAAEALERALRILAPIVVSPPEVDPSGGAAAGIAETAAAEAALAAGDGPTAVERFLAAAGAHRTAGMLDAALDACYQALAIAPADGRVHLTLAELWLDAGWREPVVEKVLLLRRFGGLVDDPSMAERLERLVADRLAGEPRVASATA